STGFAYRWFLLEFQIGLGFGSAPTDTTTLAPSYAGAFGNNMKPTVDLVPMRSRLLLGGRRVLSEHFVLEAGRGIGLDMWGGSATEPGAKGPDNSDQITSFGWEVPVWARISYQPSCGLRLFAQPSYSKELGSVGADAFVVTLGLAYDLTC